MNKKFKGLFAFIYQTIFILLFFSQFVIFFVPGSTAGNIPVGLFCIIILYLFLIVFRYNSIFKLCKRIIKFPTVKILAIFILYVTLSMFVHIILGEYKAPIYFYTARVYRFYLYSILVTFFPLIGFFYGIKLKNIIKLTFGIFYIILVIGIIQYLAIIFNINFINDIISFFSNGRSTLYLDGGIGIKLLLRVNSIFSEPSELGQFIFIFMPLGLSMAYSKYTIFSNKIVSKILQKTIIPIMLTVLILTKSPIYLVFNFIQFFVLLFIMKLRYIKRNIAKIIIITFIGLLCLSSLFTSYRSELEETYIVRLLNTIPILFDINSLASIEPSLATRIINYLIQFMSLKYHPFFGCGLTNIDIFLNSFYLKISSSLPLTSENLFCHYRIPFSSSVNKSVVWTSLAEFGICGFLLYCLFIIKIYKCVVNMLKSNYYSGIYKDFLLGICLSLISVTIISFYNLSINSINLWILYGIALAFLYNVKYSKEDFCVKKN